MSELTVIVVAAIGAYLGSVYAFMRHSGGVTAPETTAQAYRDVITVLVDLRSSAVTVSLNPKERPREREDRDEDWIAYDHASFRLGSLKESTRFLLSQKDFDAIYEVHEALYGVHLSKNYHDAIEPIDKAIEVLQQSAFRLFPRRA
ncbi:MULTISPECIES: hypothetical protein [Caballeronia]|uniref:hypothetical protein n=1 Tax=Caballeronia TaxID=1827195 RepID=UPI001FD06492|nr:MULTISPECIES: hypothetical protein [Caballeronia]MDR5799169.1 hypothetical protein [Caballeronia sp. LZ001]